MYSLIIKYSTVAVFLSSVKALIKLVSSSIISIIYAGFRKIIDIIIVNNNVNGHQMYSWEMPVFIGKVYNFTSSSLIDCLWLV